MRSATLADSVRENLAHGSTSILEELKSTSWKPSTASLDALRSYNEGVGFTQQGAHQTALKSFQAATKEDPNFALGFSGLAQAYSALGYDSEAAQASRQAMSLSADLPAQEKLRIAANHYGITNDTDKAIESYENLVKASPSDTTIRYDLGLLYEDTGGLDQAREQFAKVVELDSKFVLGLLAMGRVEIRRGNPQASLDYLDRAGSLATQLQNEAARASILQASGIAYMRLNRPDEALKRYQESLAIKQKLGDKRGMAASYVQMGEVQKTLGNPAQAEKSYREALRLRREIGDRGGMSLTLIELSWLLHDSFGRSKEAVPLLQESLGDHPGDQQPHARSEGTQQPRRHLLGARSVLRCADELRGSPRHQREGEVPPGDGRHAPQPGRRVDQDGALRPGARALQGDARPSPDFRRSPQRGARLVRHRYAVRLSGTVWCGGEFQG